MQDTVKDADYRGDLALLTNMPAQAISQLHSLEQAAESIGLYVNANKTEFMCFKWEGTISMLSGRPIKLADKFTHLSSNLLSTESYETGFLPSCGCVSTTVWMHYMEKKLDGNYKRMLHTILNISWK